MAHVKFFSWGNLPNLEISKSAKMLEFEDGNQEDGESAMSQVMPRDLQRTTRIQSGFVSRGYMTEQLQSNETQLVKEINHLESQEKERNEVRNRRSLGSANLNL